MQQIEEERIHNISKGLDVYHDDDVLANRDNSSRIDHPPEHPNDQYLFNMMMVIHYREDYLKDHLGNDVITGIAISVEQELFDHNVYFQSVEVRDTNALQIMCNNPEERDHIKHILLKHPEVLSVDVEGKRFFTKSAHD